ncbi:MAG TPA: bifunctional tRNA (adenosine(37)-N6)-threonylcarbamoyltransferase complex ATPase subunit type 1 TsaE/phosphotransferase, partial [Alphaproteobacteria bacterium]|nr:bifunctional tRNA (adenosine(37)-N6)-threonylcarbamoyltransferase complex ATPase subunit type 1 TsaE/phosphotransferase [Alphaproteobacteria bacterium]
MEKVFISDSEADTGALAEKLAAISVQGDVWALNGTLGAGKSVFARAFIQKLTGAREVPSPTFTLLQTY